MNAKPKVKPRYAGIEGPIVVLASTLFLLWGGLVQAERDITSPGDLVVGFPNDSAWPSTGHPTSVIDDNITTYYLQHFKGEIQVTGFQVKPSVGPTVVTGLNFTAASNAPECDPIAFELYGSNTSINGPYELIFSGDILDFAQEGAWPRLTKNRTPISFDNSVEYVYYQVLFPVVRDPWRAGSMQIAEVELLATVKQATAPEPNNGSVVVAVPQLRWTPGETAVFHDLYFGTNPEPSPAEYILRQYTSIYNPTTGFEPGITYYWRVDEVEADGETVHTGTVWNFTFWAKASNPDPAPKANNVTLPLLQWTPSDGAKSYNIYLRNKDLEEDFEKLNSDVWLHEFYFIPLDRQLEVGTTYEWRVDKIQENGRIVEGTVWTFTTIEEERPVDYPTLVAWWPYDEGIGFSAMDLVGLREGVIQEAFWVDGRDKLALEFDGAGAHVEAPFVRSPTDGPLSILCWVKGNTSGRVIASQQNGVNWLMASESGKLMTEMPGPETAPVSSELTDITDGVWHHVGVVWDEASVKLYVDGLLESEAPRSATAFTFGSFYTGRGSREGVGQFWQGLIDDVQVYGIALNDVQVYGDAFVDDLGGTDLAKESIAKIESDKYYTGLAVDESKTVTIDLNFKRALGAVARPGVTKETAEDFARNLGLTVVEFDERSRIVRLALPYDTARPDVAKFGGAARKLLDGSPFAEIGLAVTPTGARSPMILTHQFIVQLETGASIDDLIGDNVNVTEVEENPYRDNQYLIEVDPDAGFDALQAAHSYVNNPNVVYAVANFAIVPEFRGDSLPVQWHLNDEPNDADIDADKAQKLLKKITPADVTIAIIDTTVDHLHPDLNGNLWNGQGTNNFGYNDNPPHWHGTAVAGCVGANGVVKGSCPDCKLMLLRCNLTNYDQHKAFNFAKDNGADVICCSWGYAPGIDPPTDVNEAIWEAAEQGRGGLGCVILFAMTNEKWDNGDEENPDISSLGHVIAASGSTDQDQRSGAGFGDCMEVLAPTSGGTLRIITTDVRDAKGYNNQDIDPGVECTDVDDLDYTSCFGGTSAACATTAGVAGLVLSANPGLTREQVQSLLLVTADKIEPKTANYSETNGFSMGLDGKAATHGYGRINAFEAVRVASQGVDIFLRDNLLDWGNTERPSSTVFGDSYYSFIPYWESPDIELLPNGVNVWVRNRGVVDASSVQVELYWCDVGTPLPPFSLNSDRWESLEKKEPTGPVSVPCPVNPPRGAIDIENAATIVSFQPPDLRPGQHCCLLARVYCDDDTNSSYTEMANKVDANTPNDNNISLRNIVILNPSASVQFYVRNPYYPLKGIEYKLEWNSPLGSPVQMDNHFNGVEYELESFEQEKPVNMTVSGRLKGKVRIKQIRVVDGKDAEIIGGLTCLP